MLKNIRLRACFLFAPDDGGGAGGADDGKGGKEGGDGKDDAGGAQGTEDDEEELELGEKGQKALDAFKDRARKAERDSKRLARELEDAKKASQSEDEKKLDEAKKAARDEAQKEFQAELFESKLESAVKGRFIDDESAQALIARNGLDDFLNDDGKVDTKLIDKAVSDLLKRKPDLAADAQRKPGPLGGAKGRSGDSGASVNDWIRQQAGR